MDIDIDFASEESERRFCVRCGSAHLIGQLWGYPAGPGFTARRNDDGAWTVDGDQSGAWFVGDVDGLWLEPQGCVIFDENVFTQERFTCRDCGAAFVVELQGYFDDEDFEDGEVVPN